MAKTKRKLLGLAQFAMMMSMFFTVEHALAGRLKLLAQEALKEQSHKSSGFPAEKQSRKWLGYPTVDPKLLKANKDELFLDFLNDQGALIYRGALIPSDTRQGGYFSLIKDGNATSVNFSLPETQVPANAIQLKRVGDLEGNLPDRLTTIVRELFLPNSTTLQRTESFFIHKFESSENFWRRKQFCHKRWANGYQAESTILSNSNLSSRTIFLGVARGSEGERFTADLEFPNVIRGEKMGEIIDHEIKMGINDEIDSAFDRGQLVIRTSEGKEVTYDFEVGHGEDTGVPMIKLNKNPRIEIIEDLNPYLATIEKLEGRTPSIGIGNQFNFNIPSNDTVN